MSKKDTTRFTSKVASVEVHVTNEAIQTIEQQALASPGQETGGILIGRYEADGDVAVITAATTRPSDSGSGRAWFQRGIRGLKELLRARWGQGEYYLGEWHSHPGGAPNPSSNDVREMRAIARDAGYRCQEPILVIAGTFGTCVTLSVNVMHQYRLLKLTRQK